LIVTRIDDTRNEIPVLSARGEDLHENWLLISHDLYRPTQIKISKKYRMILKKTICIHSE